MTSSPVPRTSAAPSALARSRVDWLPDLELADAGDMLLVTDGSRPSRRHVALSRAPRSRAILLQDRLDLRIAPADHRFAAALVAAFAAPRDPAAAARSSRDLLALAARVADREALDPLLADAADGFVFADDDPATMAAVFASVTAANGRYQVREFSDGTARTISALSTEASRIASALQQLAEAQAKAGIA